jgi:hypothetical protein
VQKGQLTVHSNKNTNEIQPGHNSVTKTKKPNKPTRIYKDYKTGRKEEIKIEEN